MATGETKVHDEDALQESRDEQFDKLRTEINTATGQQVEACKASFKTDLDAKQDKLPNDQVVKWDQAIVKSEAAASKTELSRLRNRLWITMISFAVVLALLVLFVAYDWLSRSSTTPSAPASVSPPPPTGPVDLDFSATFEKYR